MKNEMEEPIDPEDLLDEVQEPVRRPARSFLSQKPKKSSFLPVVVLAIIIAVASVAGWTVRGLEDAWIGNPGKIFDDGEWWRIVTSILLHDDIKHLLSNLLFLIPFGGLLTNYFGWRAFPWAGVVLGVAGQAIALKTYPEGVNLLGASGLLYVLFGLWLSLYFRAETHLAWTNRLLRVVGFGLVMFVPAEFQPDVSYRTHAIGLALGLIAGGILPFNGAGKAPGRSVSARPESRA